MRHAKAAAKGGVATVTADALVRRERLDESEKSRAPSEHKRHARKRMQRLEISLTEARFRRFANSQAGAGAWRGTVRATYQIPAATMSALCSLRDAQTTPPRRRFHR